MRSPGLREGERADVIVLPLDRVATSPASPHAPTWGEFIGSARGAFKSAAEVDAYVRELRDEWDR